MNGLLQQGGGDICAALDVAGAQFHIAACHSPRVSTIFPNPSSAVIEVNLEERFWGKSIQLDVLSSNSRSIIQQQVEQSPKRVQHVSHGQNHRLDHQVFERMVFR